MLSQPLRLSLRCRCRCIPRTTTTTTRFYSSNNNNNNNITPHHHPNPIPIPIDLHNNNPNPAASPQTQRIAASFRDWFRASINNNPTFDRIFNALNSQNHHDLQLELKLNEALVLELLRYKSNDASSALKFFDWAGRQSYFTHTNSTCMAILKILTRNKVTSLMSDLLASLKNNNTRFHGTLVIGYALAGNVNLALHLLGQMRFQGRDLNAVSYNALLAALLDGGFFDAFKVVLHQIRLRGHENNITRTILVKSMCKQGRVLEAEEYTRKLMIQKGGDFMSGHLLSALVQGLCDQNMLSRAGDLIHEFGGSSSSKGDDASMGLAYGVWIRKLVFSGQLDAALDFFNAKKSLEGYVPDIYRYNLLISKLIKEDRLHEVCDLLMDMRDCNVRPDKVTMYMILCFFCKAGMTDVAVELYKSSADFGLTPHSLVYNYIINSLCGDGSTNEAFMLLKSSMSQGYFPRARTFSILADSLCREGKLDNMKDLLMFSLKQKFVPSMATYERFIKALCRAQRVEDGYLIHGELNKSNKTLSEATYAYLITGFKRAGRGDLAGRLLIEMQEKGYKPSLKLFKSTIRHVCEMEDDKYFLQLFEIQLSRFGHDVRTISCFIYAAAHARKPEVGRAIFQMMEKCGLVPNLACDVYMIQCYLMSNRIVDAMNFFVDIPKRKFLGSKLYHVMVVGLCKAGKADYAASFLRQGRNKGLDPSLQCYEELINLYCSENKFDQAVLLINELQKTRRGISSYIGNCLLLHSQRSLDVYRAWCRSRDASLETPASATLGKLIASFPDHIRVDIEAEQLEEIVRRCFPLRVFTYNLLLRKLCINDIEKACQLFKRMCQKGIKPNRWTYDLLVHGLYKHGRIAEADIWAEEMQRQWYLHSRPDNRRFVSTRYNEITG